MNKTSERYTAEQMRKEFESEAMRMTGGDVDLSHDVKGNYDGLVVQSMWTGFQMACRYEKARITTLESALAEAEMDAARLAYIVQFNWIGTKTRCKHGMQDSNLESARTAIDAAIARSTKNENA